MPLSLDRVAAFDVETRGIGDKRYALQPYRLRTREAEITSCALAWYQDGKLKTSATRFPQKAHHENMLRWAIANKITLVGWNMSFDAAWLCAQGLNELVMQAKWLDAMLLWQHLEREPEYEISMTKRRSWSLKAAVAEYFPQYAGYEEGVDFEDMSESMVLARLKYNRMDVAFTLRLAQIFYNRLEEQDPRQLRNALIEAAAIAPVAQRTCDGLAGDPVAAKNLAVTLEKIRVQSLEKINELHAEEGHEGTVTEAMLASPKQLGELVFNTWGLPVLKKTPKGAPSTDKEALYMLAANDEKAPLIQQYREAKGNKKKFVDNILESLRYNGDGRTRPSMRIYGTYCVPGDTEVLTPEGWVPIAAWDGGEIMQCRDDGSADFLHAEKFTGPAVTEWVRVSHPRLSARFTLGHTVPYYDQGGNWSTIKAEEMLQRHHQDLPTAVSWHRPESSVVPHAHTRLIVAAIADGWFNKAKGVWRWTLVKERKKERLRRLLQAAGVPFREYVCDAYAHRTEFTINKRSMPPWLLGADKNLGPWVLQHDPYVWVHEAKHWDGSTYDWGFKVTSKSRQHAEWLVTMASLANMKSSLHSERKEKHGGVTSTAYISTSRRAVACVQRKEVALEIGEPEQCYCPETQTGYWLARSGGTVYVTGNTGRATFASAQGKNKDRVQTGFAIHQMKNAPEFRRLITAPPGYVIVEWDAASQEYRWMAIESGDETMLSLCLPGEDPHSFMGARIGNVEYEWLMCHKDSDAEAKQMRKAGKVGNLSCVAANTKILTSTGVKTIVEVTTADLIWDGEEFVNHGGVIFNGYREVITYQGLTATPDHKVLCGGEWVDFGCAAERGWSIDTASRGLDDDRVHDREKERAGHDTVPVQVRQREDGPAGVSTGQEKHRVREVQRKENTRQSGPLHTANTSREVGAEESKRHALTMHSAHSQVVQELRCQGGGVQVSISKGRSDIHTGASTAPDVQGCGYRPQGQQRPLRAWEPSADDAQPESEKHTKNNNGVMEGRDDPFTGLEGESVHNNDSGAVRSERNDRRGDHTESKGRSSRQAKGVESHSEKIAVYDILNCGPRNRFAANGLIVHNCQYRIGYRTLRIRANVNHGMPIDDKGAKVIHSTYHSTYRGVEKYWRRQIRKCKEKGYAETLAGRRVKLVGQWSHRQMAWKLESTAVNFPIQGIGADQKYLAIKILNNVLPQVGGHFYFELHDGLYAILPEKTAMRDGLRIRDMLSNMPYKKAWGFQPPVPLPWDMKIGPNWGDMKEIK